MTSRAEVARRGATKQTYNRPELDALRLFAFACVFFFHSADYAPIDRARHALAADLSTLGAFGVPVFFLLSAFLITELLLRERDATGRVRVGAFYARRVLRIWPLYFAALFGLVALERLLPGVGPTKPGQITALSLFYGNWYVTLNGWIAEPVDPLWSISVEEQFYLLVPLLVALGGRRAISFFALAVLGASYFVIWRYAAHQTQGDNGEWTNGLVQFQFFAAGCLLSVALRGRAPDWPILARVCALSSGVACWLVALRVFGVKSWDAHPTPFGALLGWLLVLAGAILIFLSVLGANPRLTPAAAAYGGRISYGLYLSHSLILYLVFVRIAPLLKGRLATPVPDGVAQVSSLVAAAALTFLLSHVSYRYFETPILRLKSRFAVIDR